MQQDAEERVQMQVILHELGSTGRFSLYDYLDFLDNLGERKKYGTYTGNYRIGTICYIDWHIR